MKITRNQLRKIIREQLDLSPADIHDYGLEPGSREVLTSSLPWVNKGGLQNRPEMRTANLSPGTEIEVGNSSQDGSKTEVYDVRRDALFTVRTNDLISATQR